MLGLEEIWFLMKIVWKCSSLGAHRSEGIRQRCREWCRRRQGNHQRGGHCTQRHVLHLWWLLAPPGARDLQPQSDCPWVSITKVFLFGLQTLTVLILGRDIARFSRFFNENRAKLNRTRQENRLFCVKIAYLKVLRAPEIPVSIISNLYRVCFAVNRLFPMLFLSWIFLW